jgi:hypothetical protein
MTELKWKESGVDVISLVLAVFLFLTPWIFGFVPDTTAAANAWISAVIIGGLATYYDHNSHQIMRRFAHPGKDRLPGLGVK